MAKRKLSKITARIGVVLTLVVVVVAALALPIAVDSSLSALNRTVGPDTAAVVQGALGADTAAAADATLPAGRWRVGYGANGFGKRVMWADRHPTGNGSDTIAVAFDRHPYTDVVRTWQCIGPKRYIRIVGYVLYKTHDDVGNYNPGYYGVEVVCE